MENMQDDHTEMIPYESQMASSEYESGLATTLQKIPIDGQDASK